MDVDSKRVTALHTADPNRRGDFVLYWMQIERRAEANDALNFAVDQANRLNLPVLVYEGLRHDYPHASDRIHTFMLENARGLRKRLNEKGIGHAFYLERAAADRRPIVRELMGRAALVVTDDYPAFIIPGHNRALARLAGDARVPAYAVDSRGVVPLAEFPRREYAARTIRPKIHRLLPYYLTPREEPRPRRSGTRIDPGFRAETWREPIAAKVAACDIDHRVPPVPHRFAGGRDAALEKLRRFLDRGLDRYDDESNDPARGATSELSPYLHFGMIGAREVALTVRDARPGADRNVAAFLEQLIVRRELSLNFCAREPRHETLAALPDWAQRTLRRPRRRPARGGLHPGAVRERPDARRALERLSGRASPDRRHPQLRAHAVVAECQRIEMTEGFRLQMRPDLSFRDIGVVGKQLDIEHAPGHEKGERTDLAGLDLQKGLPGLFVDLRPGLLQRRILGFPARTQNLDVVPFFIDGIADFAGPAFQQIFIVLWHLFPLHVSTPSGA